MRRVVAYFEWRGSWWRTLVSSIGQLHVPDDVAHGLSAYAHKQASYSDRLGKKARAYWSPALAKLGLAPEWVVAEGDLEEVDVEEDDVDDSSDTDEEGSGEALGPNSDLDTDDFDLFELED
jgi:hypothetical protein